MRILSSCNCVSTTVCLHQIDFNQAFGEKAGWEIHKNVTYCFEQILNHAEKAA